MSSVLDTEEDASKLTFGKAGTLFFTHPEDNEYAQYMTNEELFGVLLKYPDNSTETLESTRKYLEKVVAKNSKDNIQTMCPEIRTKLNATELTLKVSGDLARLHEYEMASLSNIIKSDGASAEEALAWVPSLVRFEEEDVERVVAMIADAKSRGSRY